METKTNNKVFEGIHATAKEFIDNDFSEQEKSITRYWSSSWYITCAGAKNIGGSDYKYMLIKATPSIEEALSLNQEVVVIFSPYKDFEPRSLGAFDQVRSVFQEQRYEKLCYVFISADPKIEYTYNFYLTNQESQIIVPFSYNSFRDNKDNPNYIKNQFRKYFYMRDLFDYSEPLKKDTYFFGRNDIVINCIQKHKDGLNFGLFGLRKTGKTSIIYDIKRKLCLNNSIGVLIDCQDPSFNMRRWNNALYFVIITILNQFTYDIGTIDENDFTEQNASALFITTLKKITHKYKVKILLLFDEIENITFGKSSVSHWAKELDFVYFWQSIRSNFQNTEDVFTFGIFGTNPLCVELPTILEKDNPIFNMFSPTYINGFDVEQTREMVRKLSKIMGIKFEETIYSKITEDYGGHPFLIRRICSKISKINTERPVYIDRIRYNIAKEQFNRESEYFNMLLEVLNQFYPDEYEMLKLLACNDIEAFMFFSNNDSNLVKHLIGYGIIKFNGDIFDFKIDAIKDFLLRTNNPTKIKLSKEDKWAKICIARNNIEIELRKMIKTVLRISSSMDEAKKYVINKIYAKDDIISLLSYNDLFDSRKCKIYFSNLTNLMLGKWDLFVDYFGKQDIFIQSMNVINSEGRFDAHATIPDDDEMLLISGALSIIQKGIDNYNYIIN